MKILVCGVGAIGSNLVAHLVPDLKNNHEITILDRDKLEERNITAGTQWYTPDQIGLSKVSALQFNIYKWFDKEVDIVEDDILEGTWNGLHGFDLVIDCFDNYEARKTLQENKGKSELLHIGFSDQFTFAIEWAENYQVPTNIRGLDICELEGASAFVGSVSSLGALVAGEFAREGKKLEILGGKFYAKIA